MAGLFLRSPTASRASQRYLLMMERDENGNFNFIPLLECHWLDSLSQIRHPCAKENRLGSVNVCVRRAIFCAVFSVRYLSTVWELF